MDTEAPISTTLPPAYTCWREAMADAQRRPAWNDKNRFIEQRTRAHFWDIDAPVLRYEKTYMVAQAEAEQARSLAQAETE